MHLFDIVSVAVEECIGGETMFLMFSSLLFEASHCRSWIT